jgi:hypothetical protein
MTNVPPPPPGDVPPPSGNVPPAGSVPPPPPAPGPASYSTPAPGPSPYAPPSGGPSPKQGLSLTSFIIGLVGLIFATWLVPVLGLLIGAAAVVLGFIAKGKEPNAPQWMWIVGVISGFLTILINLFITIGFFLLIGAATQLPTSP